MNMSRFTCPFAAAALTVCAFASSPAVADWTVNAGPSSTAFVPQDIVVSLKTNPLSHPEAACLAVTMARSLRGDFLDPDEFPPDEFPDGTGANVTLFPVLAGVAIGDADVVSRRRFRCATPEGIISLQENLEDFLCDTGDRDDCPEGPNMNNLVQCPFCWIDRYGYALPDYGVLNPDARRAID